MLTLSDRASWRKNTHPEKHPHGEMIPPATYHRTKRNVLPMIERHGEGRQSNRNTFPFRNKEKKNFALFLNVSSGPLRLNFIMGLL